MRRAVLVIDDDDDVRESLCAVLEDEGYSAVGAEHGRAALQRLREGFRPCVILLDLMMPVMDGEAFRREQLGDAALSEIPVLIITAAGQRVASSIAASGSLQKPLRVEDLLEAVGRSCSSQGAGTAVNGSG